MQPILSPKNGLLVSIPAQAFPKIKSLSTLRLCVKPLITSPCMKIISQTPRLLIREIETYDAGAVFELNQNPNVILYTSDPAFKTIEDARHLIETVIKQQYKSYRHGRWAVLLKDTGTFIGWCGLKFMPELNQVDLGYRFMETYWGKGFATEAAMASLHYGFAQFNYNQIIGRVMKQNMQSIKVLKKCGMTFSHEAELHEHPAYIYKISKEDFLSQTKI